MSEKHAKILLLSASVCQLHLLSLDVGTQILLMRFSQISCKTSWDKLIFLQITLIKGLQTGYNITSS